MLFEVFAFFWKESESYVSERWDGNALELLVMRNEKLMGSIFFGELVFCCCAIV